LLLHCVVSDYRWVNRSVYSFLRGTAKFEEFLKVRIALLIQYWGDSQLEREERGDGSMCMQHGYA
jgi:hypothetical protein